MKYNSEELRKDNIQKIKEDISNTMENMAVAEGMIEATDDPKIKQKLQKKNERREQALEDWRDDVKNKVSD